MYACTNACLGALINMNEQARTCVFMSPCVHMLSRSIKVSFDVFYVSSSFSFQQLFLSSLVRHFLLSLFLAHLSLYIYISFSTLNLFPFFLVPLTPTSYSILASFFFPKELLATYSETNARIASLFIEASIIAVPPFSPPAFMQVATFQRLRFIHMWCEHHLPDRVLPG